MNIIYMQFILVGNNIFILLKKGMSNIIPDIN